MTEPLTQDEIDSLLKAISENDSADIANIKPSSKKMTKIKIYDFKRPDKFSKEHQRTVRSMYETFCRQTTTSLSAQLTTLVQVHVATVDQLTYEEFTRSIPKATTLALIQMDPLEGQGILEIDPTITFSMIDRLFGGNGESSKTSRELTEIESTVMENVVVRLLGNMREAWSNVIDLRPRLTGIETNAQFAQIVPPNEMVILVTLEVKIGEVEGMMNFCIPYLTLEPIIPKLSTQFWYSSVKKGASTENLNNIKGKLARTEVDLTVEVASMKLTLNDVLSMKLGDIVKFSGARSDSLMTIKIGDKAKFEGRPGIINKRNGIRIVKQLEEIEQEENVDIIEEYYDE